MKRILIVAFITSYIAALSYGNLCHVLRFNVAAHPMMYMVVWDMFCGWTAFDSRIHIVAEGESGKYYDLTHPPWGEIHAFGYLGRENYDPYNNHSGTMGANVLKHTSHEPMSRFFVVEECWQKKFNLPDKVWAMRYDDPKNVQKYFRIRSIHTPDGMQAQNFDSWVAEQGRRMVLSNPRLVEQSQRGRAMFIIDNRRPVEMSIDAESSGGGLPTRVLAPGSGN